jgi:hypothetical protein
LQRAGIIEHGAKSIIDREALTDAGLFGMHGAAFSELIPAQLADVAK